MFAMDSVPVIFAITTDTLIVYISNILATLGHSMIDFIGASEALGDHW